MGLEGLLDTDSSSCTGVFLTNGIPRFVADVHSSGLAQVVIGAQTGNGVFGVGIACACNQEFAVDFEFLVACHQVDCTNGVLGSQTEAFTGRWFGCHRTGCIFGVASHRGPRRHFSPNTLAGHFFWLYRKAGVTGASSHSGRKTFLTSLASQGISVFVLAKLAGHKDIKTTMRYVTTSDDMLRKAVELV
jgi:hypothetical protein